MDPSGARQYYSRGGNMEKQNPADEVTLSKMTHATKPLFGTFLVSFEHCVLETDGQLLLWVASIFTHQELPLILGDLSEKEKLSEDGFLYHPIIWRACDVKHFGRMDGVAASFFNKMLFWVGINYILLRFWQANSIYVLQFYKNF